MSKHAGWWDPESGGQDSAVVRHAPDEHNYHYPDGRQLERMRSGIGMPVVVPKALRDGQSSAFDGSKASVVHVDPDAPDGGAIVDFSQVRKVDVNKALSTSRFPHQVYYKLGVAPTEEDTPVRRRPPERRENPLIGSGYVVPASDQHGRQVWEQPANPDYGNYQMAYSKEEHVLPAAPQLPPIPQPNHGPQATQVNQPAPYQQPAPAYHQPPPQYQQPVYQQPPPPPPQPSYYAPPAPDPNLQNMLGQVLQGMQAISSRLSAVEEDNRPARSNSSRARGSNGVSTQPVGRDIRDDHFERAVPIGQPPRRRKQADDESDTEALYDNSKPVFEDDSEEIGHPKAKPRRRSSGKSRPVPQHLDDYIEEDDEVEQHRKGVIVGFETLKIPYINGPKPLKPKRKVIFDYGDTRGKQSATYHDVVESLHNVVLVYDTRYEDGVQCEPPDLGPSKIVELHVPSMKKTYRVGSIGQSFSHGIFDFIVLVKSDSDQELDYEEEA